MSPLKKILTPKEIAVTSLLAEGLSNNEISMKLGILNTTTGMHIGNIFRKTGMTNRTQIALRWVKENG